MSCLPCSQLRRRWPFNWWTWKPSQHLLLCLLRFKIPALSAPVSEHMPSFLQCGYSITHLQSQKSNLFQGELDSNNSHQEETHPPYTLRSAMEKGQSISLHSHASSPIPGLHRHTLQQGTSLLLQGTSTAAALPPWEETHFPVFQRHPVPFLGGFSHFFQQGAKSTIGSLSSCARRTGCCKGKGSTHKEGRGTVCSALLYKSSVLRQPWGVY